MHKDVTTMLVKLQGNKKNPDEVVRMMIKTLSNIFITPNPDVFKKEFYKIHEDHKYHITILEKQTIHI